MRSIIKDAFRRTAAEPVVRGQYHKEEIHGESKYFIWRSA